MVRMRFLICCMEAIIYRRLVVCSATGRFAAPFRSARLLRLALHAIVPDLSQEVGNSSHYVDALLWTIGIFWSFPLRPVVE